MFTSYYPIVFFLHPENLNTEIVNKCYWTHTCEHLKRLFYTSLKGCLRDSSSDNNDNGTLPISLNWKSQRLIWQICRFIPRTSSWLISLIQTLVPNSGRYADTRCNNLNIARFRRAKKEKNGGKWVIQTLTWHLRWQFHYVSNDMLSGDFKSTPCSFFS